MDAAIDECLISLNNESRRLAKLVETSIGNWIPATTFREAVAFVARFEEQLPKIKQWLETFETDPANQTEIWLRQGLALINYNANNDEIEVYPYGSGKSFTAPNGDIYILDPMEDEPRMPPMTPEIEAIHEGKPCEDNGFFCWLCDDQDFRREQQRQILVKASRNIFINAALEEEFIKDAAPILKPPPSWNLQAYFDRFRQLPYTDEMKFNKGSTFGQQVKAFVSTYIPALFFWYTSERDNTVFYRHNPKPCDEYLKIARKYYGMEKKLLKIKGAIARITTAVNSP
jgi:hypothetical protein